MVGTATGAGTVNVTIDGTAVGPIAIAAGRTAFEITQDIAAAIDVALGPGNGRAFNTFPPSDRAHLAANPGNDVVFTALADTVPGVVVSVPAMNFTDSIDFNDEEPALAVNYGDGDPDTIDFFIIDTLTTGNRGDAWVTCAVNIGVTSDLRNTSYIVLSAGDTAGDNPHTAPHEAGRFIMNFCGDDPGAFNLMNTTSAADSISARKRLTDVQCMAARAASDGTILKHQ